MATGVGGALVEQGKDTGIGGVWGEIECLGSRLGGIACSTAKEHT